MAFYQGTKGHGLCLRSRTKGVVRASGGPKGVACDLEEPMGMDCVLGDERAWSVSQRNQKA